ncbi:monocyte to macrophage differentiation factor 2-like [Gigantopelta aegis]|uniref:monocyte to macrophage differentiation factor 2-like n=1 Tax=Gigantopelta aegis TaxID=1735272 RepID=UPI001B88C927|nr:monocyte to macrophage differentiation factor 2-like [Gigantopelta aegis]
MFHIWNNIHHDRLMNCRAGPGKAYEPTDVEHLANMISHGIWIIPSLFGLLFMVFLSASDVQLTNAVIYGFALLALFTVSTTFHTISYHSKKYSSSVKDIFHIGDRVVIYIFIAASYTPWLTMKDLGSWGLYVVWIIWFLAAVGIAYQYTYHEQYKWLEILFYLLIGICPAAVIFAMNDRSGVYELALGGVVYVSGVVFFKCDGIIPFAHAIWHCFVLVGAIFHYYAVCTYLLGTKELDQNLQSSGILKGL